MVVVITFVLKNVNDEKINGTKVISFSKVGSVIGLVVTWFVCMVFFAVNLDYLVNPNGNTIGLTFTGWMVFTSLFITMSSWWTVIINIKKSKKTKEEKRNFYLENNRVWNVGLAGLLWGLIGACLFGVIIFVAITPPATKDFEFHPIRLIEFMVILGAPLYLAIKVPKWVRKYAEKFI